MLAWARQDRSATTGGAPAAVSEALRRSLVTACPRALSASALAQVRIGLTSGQQISMHNAPPLIRLNAWKHPIRRGGRCQARFGRLWVSSYCSEHEKRGPSALCVEEPRALHLPRPRTQVVRFSGQPPPARYCAFLDLLEGTGNPISGCACESGIWTLISDDRQGCCPAFSWNQD